MPRLSFLRRRADYLALRAGGRTDAPSLLLVRRPRDDGSPGIRVGLTVTKKLGGAVTRNRIRRRLREAARVEAAQHGEPGCDYLIVARSAAQTRAWPDLLDDLKRALLSLRGRSA